MAGRDTRLSIVVIGYTGEVGKELVRSLAVCKAIDRVSLLGRRDVNLPIDSASASKFEQKRIDFDQLMLDNSSQLALFANHDAVFCCLGTTRGKAGVDGFIKVDRDYVNAASSASKAAGVKQFHLVSSSGADAASCLLYPRIKGETEAALRDLGFEHAIAYRPKMLMCDREETRIGEGILRALLAPCQCMCPTLLTTPTALLANAMVAAAVTGGNGFRILENDQIFRLANDYNSID